MLFALLARCAGMDDRIEDRLDWARLTLTQGVAPRTLRKALARFGAPAGVLSAPIDALSACIGEKAAALLAQGPASEALERTAAWLREPNHSLIALGDADYPQALLDIANPPLVLYAIGRVELLRAPSIAIVGSRSATPQGLRDAEAMARSLGDAGLAIVSGLAAGIDAAAHLGGLAAAGSTIAVIGTGADRVYPARHHALAKRIAAEGLIVSEFALGTPALAKNFPRRNRIISGVSLGCLVVEAALASGSLITARMAAEQGREVFAMPGSVHSPLARGCHALIHEGAKLVENARDVLDELRLPEAALTPARAAGPPATSDDVLLAHLGFEPIDIDTLCSNCGLTPDVVSAMLLKLELEGEVAMLPGSRFQRLA